MVIKQPTQVTIVFRRKASLTRILLLSNLCQQKCALHPSVLRSQPNKTVNIGHYHSSRKARQSKKQLCVNQQTEE
jgi:hypothetical protein